MNNCKRQLPFQGLFCYEKYDKKDNNWDNNYAEEKKVINIVFHGKHYLLYTSL